MKKMKGFTLVELVVAMGVTVVLMGAVYMAVNAAQRHSSAIERKVAAQQDVKPVLDLMAMEIGMASYNPNCASGIWLNPTTCAAVAAIPNYKGIQEATANSITVEMDITNPPDGSGNCTATNGNGSLGDCNEIIRYEYLSGATDLRITRETIRCASGTRTTGGAQPFLGAASGNTRAVRVINDVNGNGVYDVGVDIPVFRYYDGTGTEIAATALPAGIPNIRRIDITLAVETEDVDPNTNQRRRLIYSTSVIPRNHAISP